MISFMGRGKGLRVGKGFIVEGRRRKREGKGQKVEGYWEGKGRGR